VSAGQLRGMETRIAEDMTSVLDFLSRLQGAINDGNWHYAHDKAGQLVGAAKQLEAALGHEVDRKRSDPAARPKAVAAAIRRYARHYSAGRALYPAPPDPAAEDRKAKIASNVAEILGRGGRS
jgi:hypothetical protein